MIAVKTALDQARGEGQRRGKGWEWDLWVCGLVEVFGVWSWLANWKCVFVLSRTRRSAERSICRISAPIEGCSQVW